jgi:transcriptional regulator with XRE-family HTH domain
MARSRNKNTVGVTSEGKFRVRTRLSEKGWSQTDLADFSGISASTVKRLLRGESIRANNFNDLLDTLELTLEEAFIFRDIASPIDAQNNKVDESNGLRSSINYQLGVFMTGLYSNDKKAEIERVVQHLRTLMVNAEFVFEDSNGSLLVRGDFEPEQEQQIRMTIQHLEKLLTVSTVTW